jgi:hypothetical protein
MEQVKENVMKNFANFLKDVESESANPKEGDVIELIINEELAVSTDIIAVEENYIHIGLDTNAFQILTAAGLVKELK